MTFRPPYFSKFDLPPLPVTFNQSLQLDILGKDAKLVGQQISALPPYGAIPKVLDWQYKLNPPAFPTVTRRTELPFGPPPSPFHTFYKIPQGFPTVLQRTEVPYGPSPKVADWQFYLNPPAVPLVSVRTEVPLGPPPNPFWILSTNPNLFPSIVVTPKVSQRTENPLLPSSNPFWISYLNPPAFPSVSQRTEVPYGPPPNQFWTQYLTPLYNFP